MPIGAKVEVLEQALPMWLKQAKVGRVGRVWDYGNGIVLVGFRHGLSTEVDLKDVVPISRTKHSGRTDRKPRRRTYWH